MSEIRTVHRSPLRVAVVGLGYWGPNLVRVCHEIDDVEVAWVCDLDDAALSKISHRYPGTRATREYDQVLSDPSVDAVLLATPVTTHHRLALAALDAGKHCFVEKPLAASSEEALSLQQAAESTGLVLMPGHTFLYSPPVVYSRDMIRSGALGDIYFISTSRVNLGLHQADISVVWDLAPHDFSILRYWLDEKPSMVSAMSRSCVFGDTDDVAFINLQFPSGTIAHVQLSWLAPVKLRRTAVVGSQKMLVYDDTSNESVRIFDSGADLPAPDTFGEFRLTYRTGDILSPRLDAAEPLGLELCDFRDAIRTGSTPRSSVQVGVDVVAMTDAVDRSLALGGAPVSFDEPRAAANR